MFALELIDDTCRAGAVREFDDRHENEPSW
jgi:hypothetical protein